MLRPERLEWSVEVTKWVVLVEQQTAHTHTADADAGAGFGGGLGVLLCVFATRNSRPTHTRVRTHLTTRKFVISARIWLHRRSEGAHYERARALKHAELGHTHTHTHTNLAL